MYYFFYEWARAAVLKSRKSSSKALSTLESMLCGLVAGSATAIFCNPIWVMQIRQDVWTMDAANHDSSASSPGIMGIVLYILATEGIGAFTRGLGPTLIRSVMLVARNGSRDSFRLSVLLLQTAQPSLASRWLIAS